MPELSPELVSTTQTLPEPTLAEQVRMLRAELKLTQFQLALRLNVQPRTIQRWELGKSKPHEVYMRRIRALLEVPAENE